MPSYVREKLAQIKPRYIMNLAIRGPDAWIAHFYSATEGTISSTIQNGTKKNLRWTDSEQLDMLKEDNTDQVSCCSFGESNKVFVLRSTDDNKGWHARPSRYIPKDLHTPSWLSLIGALPGRSRLRRTRHGYCMGRRRSIRVSTGCQRA